MTTAAPTLTVAIPTFRRPAVLASCLDAVLAQTRAARTDGSVAAASVLVIDNDPDASARDHVLSRGGEVRYVHEPRPGIAAARARALREVDTRLLAFLDDDEIPRAGWLDSLLETWRDTGAAAVMGRVVSVLDGDVDPWITAGDLFGRPRHATGTRVRVAAAGNLLLDAQWVRGHGVDFDLRLGLGGGEDTLFSRELVDAGGVIVWCDESVAEDHVEAARVTRRWLVRRFFSHGHTEVVVDLLARPGRSARVRVRARAVAGGSARVLVAGARFVAGAITRSARDQALAMRLASRGAGMVWAGVGAAHQEYERPAGQDDSRAS